MRYLWKLLPAFVLTAALASCGGNADPDPTPTPVAPTTVSLSSVSANVAQPEEEITLDITAPSRPEVSGAPDWVTVKLGIYDAKTFKMTGVKITVAANPTYETRTATLTFKAGTASATFALSQAGKEPVVVPTLPDNDAVAMARKIGLGWNMGNELEAHNNGFVDETAWTGVLATQATFDAVKAAGFTSVRIPISWLDKIGDAPDYTLSSDRLERVAEVVGYAKNAGLVTIINTHHDGADSQYWLSVLQGADNNTITEKIKKVWMQIAERFKDEGDWLIFESFNEIQDGGWGWSSEYQTAAGKKRQNDILNGWNQTFVDAVRTTGGNNANRWLGVPGYAADPVRTLDDGFVVPEDPAGKIMVAVHNYTPYDFCQTAKASEWGHTRKTNLTDESYNEDYLRAVFNRLYQKWVSKNIPVYWGEFGCVNRSAGKARQFQLYYLEYVSKLSRCFGMGGLIWDNGAKSGNGELYGIIHHGTGEYLDASYGPMIVNACKKGFQSEDASYTLDTIYDAAPTP